MNSIHDIIKVKKDSIHSVFLEVIIYLFIHEIPHFVIANNSLY